MQSGYIHNSRIRKLKLEQKTVTSNGVVLPSEGCDGLSSVTVNVPSESGGIGDGVPVEITTESQMDAFVVAENIGKVAKYTGTTGKYTKGTLYLIEVM